MIDSIICWKWLDFPPIQMSQMSIQLKLWHTARALHLTTLGGTAKDKSSFENFSPFIQLRKQLLYRWHGILEYVQSSLNIDLVITKDPRWNDRHSPVQNSTLSSFFPVSLALLQSSLSEQKELACWVAFSFSLRCAVTPLIVPRPPSNTVHAKRLL